MRVTLETLEPQWGDNIPTSSVGVTHKLTTFLVKHPSKFFRKLSNKMRKGLEI